MVTTQTIADVSYSFVPCGSSGLYSSIVIYDFDKPYILRTIVTESIKLIPFHVYGVNIDIIRTIQSQIPCIYTWP